MSIINKLRAGVGAKPEVASTTQDPEKVTSVPVAVQDNEAGNDFPEDLKAVDGIDASLPTQDAQYGVQKIEAVALAWTKKSLAGLLVSYVSTFLRYAVNHI